MGVNGENLKEGSKTMSVHGVTCENYCKYMSSEEGVRGNSMCYRGYRGKKPQTGENQQKASYL